MYAFIRECQSESCFFRFPELALSSRVISCPRCGGTTAIVHRFDPFEDNRPSEKPINQAQNLACVLDNIRSVYNVGSIFRTIQGFGVSKAFLCGITPTPDHKNFSKTSMFAEQSVSWEYSLNAYHLVVSLREKGYLIISLESKGRSSPIQDYKLPGTNPKIALVVGNEKVGIDPSILAISDQVLSIPIYGENKSYNVTVAFGVGLYVLLYSSTSS